MAQPTRENLISAVFDAIGEKAAEVGPRITDTWINRNSG
jgi:hypothetical protein